MDTAMQEKLYEIIAKERDSREKINYSQFILAFHEADHLAAKMFGPALIIRETRLRMESEFKLAPIPVDQFYEILFAKSKEQEQSMPKINPE
jgi:hypothetical protein